MPVAWVAFEGGCARRRISKRVHSKLLSICSFIRDGGDAQAIPRVTGRAQAAHNRRSTLLPQDGGEDDDDDDDNCDGVDENNEVFWLSLSKCLDIKVEHLADSSSRQAFTVKEFVVNIPCTPAAFWLALVRREMGNMAIII